jgi:hypothetical protein
MEEIKDMYNPVSDMDILADLRKPKKRGRKLKLMEDTGMTFKHKMILVFIWGSVAITGLTLLTVKTMVSVNRFFDENTFAYHKMIDVKLQLPVTIEKRSPEVIYVKVSAEGKTSKELTQKEKEVAIQKSSYSKILTGIWILETEKGSNKNKDAHHNECNNLGLTNEFGYRALDNYCFNSFTESVEAVDKWIDEQLQTKTVSEVLCYYSSGKVESTCAYAQNYKALEKSGGLALK